MKGTIQKTPRTERKSHAARLPRRVDRRIPGRAAVESITLSQPTSLELLLESVHPGLCHAPLNDRHDKNGEEQERGKRRRVTHAKVGEAVEVDVHHDRGR